MPGLKSKDAANIPESERDYFLERKYPSFGNLVPRDVASRNAKQVCDEGRGVGSGLAVFLDFTDAIKRVGEDTIRAKYGNLFDMYAQITGENPYKGPMMIYPAVHYTMGGLWVDYNLMTTVPGLYALADGYFVIPYTVGDYLATIGWSDKIGTDHPAFKEAMDGVHDRVNKLISIKGKKTVDEFHRQLGLTMWEYCGMSRTEEGLKKAKKIIQDLRAEFWTNVNVLGSSNELNQELEKAGRVADFLELGELMVDDALNRSESCGGHFREESQTPEGEALRKDDEFAYVAAWEFKGDGQPEVLNKEELKFENVKLTQRSYK
jgi:succinate dehydrogenase / fumarate reductase flavoprotein subunit